MIKKGDTVQIIKEGHQHQWAYCEVTEVGAEVNNTGCYCFVRRPDKKEERLIYPVEIQKKEVVMAKTKLFQSAKFQSAFLKAGILGFAGSGKTYTASLIAIGLHKLIQSKKPVCFMDTETGSDFMIQKFKKEGIKLLISKSRSFTEMLELIDEAEKVSDILIIDSVSAIWYDFMESFKKKKGRKFIQFQDWGILKPTWRNEFTDKRYLNSQLHIIICGRAGYEYDYVENEDGSKELHKMGTKMRAETEFGYEPSFLIEMERVKENKDGKIILTHRCTVIKDRADILDGQTFENPTFENFKPSIEILNFGGEHKGIDLEIDSQSAFDNTGQTDWSKEQKMRHINLDGIKTELSYAYPSTSGKDKQAKIEILEKVFGTKNWTEITEQEKDYPSEVLKEKLEEIKKKIKAQKEPNKSDDIIVLLSTRIVPKELQAEANDVLEQGMEKEKEKVINKLTKCLLKTNEKKD